MQLQSSITTRLEYQHKSLLDLIEGLSDEQVRRQVILGKWSIFENIVHLATYQKTFMSRFEEILKNDQPSFDRYTAETDPLFYDNCMKSTREIIQEMMSERKILATVLLALKADQFKRTGHHPLFGTMTLIQWIQFFLLHEAHHLFTIFKLAASFR
jgi:uncharacterized damage-inducible protein DinB